MQPIEVSQSDEFEKWLAHLPDRDAKARILARIRRIGLGNLGDVKFFEGIGELRLDVGPGYRIYFVKRGGTLIILLCGGDKSSQRRDIERAKWLAKQV